MGSYWYIHLTLPGLGRSSDKLKTLFLYYHNAYGHQTRQSGDIPWRAPTQKETWSFIHVVLWGHVTY